MWSRLGSSRVLCRRVGDSIRSFKGYVGLYIMDHIQDIEN
jgi:hypothetical protein